MKTRTLSILLITIFLVETNCYSQKSAPQTENKINAELVSGLKFRSIGPALMSGRIIDFAVNPENIHEYYVAVACGGVWKTTNSGTTWESVFDNEKSFSIGCVVIDPNNTNVVWVGSGENNSQRSVSWGDGIYKSTDGGKSWKNMGLQKSEHIGKIVIDPRNSEVVYVAAQGPLWGPGGDRGLYKTIDGGKTWTAILTISENTGVTDIVMDPRNPDILIAASYQRRRHVWTLINGGPESAMYKSTDAGKTWNKINSGLPSGDIGRIGLAISPVNPDIVFAIIEASEGAGGFFKSTDRGESWSKTNNYSTVSAQYYNEIFCSPKNEDIVFLMDTYAQISTDGGKTFRSLGNRNRHVDDHAMWINPEHTDHMLIGGDGGIYETFDGAATWQFKANLPVTQFYRVAVDNSEPFYYVYGGTQDNNSQGGPSQTKSVSGIVNSDWFITQGGDGFESAIDPTDPNIVYSQSQYGGLVRFDRRSGEAIGIQPMEGKNEKPYRWNWDAPLLLSPHASTRLYFAANVLFKSNDRGNSWEIISPDLTRQIDRNSLKVMDKVWPLEAVAKNASTSIYGNIVSLSESPEKEGLIYVGSDDGMISITEDGGKNWRFVKTITGIPEFTFISCLLASAHDENVVYACFDNHKKADFKPYIMKSTDKGKSWTPIASNLTEPDVIYTIAEDFINQDLLFIGTEYGCYFTNDGGKNWNKLKSGLPTIAVRDIAIQKRESDLVLATFGRGFYILDDYSPLRQLTTENLNKTAYIFPIKKAWMYITEKPLGWGEKGSLGDSYFTAPNPPFGATFTWYLKEAPKTKKQLRKEQEKKDIKNGKEPHYPTYEELRAEDIEQAPYLVFTIKDADGNIVRRLTATAKKGINRINWDLRYSDVKPVYNGSNNESESGLLALPGKYTVSIEKNDNDVITNLVGPVEFETEILGTSSIPVPDRMAIVNFGKKVNELRRAVLAANNITNDLENKIKLIKQALKLTSGQVDDLVLEARRIELEIYNIRVALSGDPTLAKRNESVPSSINDRINSIVWDLWSTTAAPTLTYQKNYNIASELFEENLAKLKILIDTDIKALESKLEKMGAPYTPGRFPEWNSK